MLHTDAERAVSELVGTSSEKYTFIVRRARSEQHQSNGGAEPAVMTMRLKESLAVFRAEMNEGGADVCFTARGLTDVCMYIALLVTIIFPMQMGQTFLFLNTQRNGSCRSQVLQCSVNLC